ncbi:MAG TPA: cysteine desulfurase family protein [Candidatus Krumholzibacterium sp.]|nr:cysteine desulfurase family protein [Candidatus Krumholzibacterium sp.]
MKRIYLDHQAAMPVDPRVVEAALPWLSDRFANPSSQYSAGIEAREAVEEARSSVSALIGGSGSGKIVFTSGATEASNLAIRGAAYRNAEKKGRKVLASAIEHMSVLNPVKELQKNGFDTALVPVDASGTVDLDRLADMVTEDTVVTSIMLANNEIGTIQPIREISRIVREKGSFLHVDAVAAAGRIPIDVEEDGIDLLTLSSNDLYGPLGAGALYVRKGVALQSVMPGGGQEKGLRSGTENVFAIVGMGEAARLASAEMKDESARLAGIRDRYIEGLLGIEETYLTGHPGNRLPHHASVRFTAIEGEGILLWLDRAGIQVSTGSACSSQTLQASHVLLALGLEHEEVHGSMVLTLGRTSSMDDVDYVVKNAGETVGRLRQMSPVWNTRGKQ